MGDFVDYMIPPQWAADPCALLADGVSSKLVSSTAGEGYYLVPPFLLDANQGGSQINYGVNFRGRRHVIPFWGANGGSSLGGCCHSSIGADGRVADAASWGQAFEIHIRLYKENVTKTGAAMRPATSRGCSGLISAWYMSVLCTTARTSDDGWSWLASFTEDSPQRELHVDFWNGYAPPGHSNHTIPRSCTHTNACLRARMHCAWPSCRGGGGGLPRSECV